MEKKSKKSIVIGLTSLFLVMLVLVGLTYAYYRAKIIGNDSLDPSISAQSRNMEITYEDGTAVLSTTGRIEPGFTASKTFYVKNTGTVPVKYSVVLEELTNSFVRNQDWQVTLTKNGTEVIKPTDNVHLAVGTQIDQTLLGSETITAGSAETPTTDTYVLTITYKDLPLEDQSIDMGKSLSFKVNISEEQYYTWDDAPEGTLLYTLKNNNAVETPKTTPGEEISATDEAILASTEDDYGTSYYFRGAVENNYVNFAGMCWKIVRVTGDGSIKLILEDQYTTCDDNETEITTAVYTGEYNITTGSFGYNTNTQLPYKELADYLNPTTELYPAMSPSFKNFQVEKLSSYLSYLKPGGWCYGDEAYSTKTVDFTTTQPLTTEEKDAIYRSGTCEGECYWWKSAQEMYYGAGVRLDYNTTKTPTLKCNGTIMNTFGENEEDMYVATLTADEVAFAGATESPTPDNFYLTNHKKLSWWTLSLHHFNGTIDYGSIAIYGYEGFELDWVALYSEYGFRPSVLLKSNTVITDGEGTIGDPYVIE